jgi:Holliday junction resolvasome RuvABC endonuclease subunit
MGRAKRPAPTTARTVKGSRKRKGRPQTGRRSPGRRTLPDVVPPYEGEGVERVLALDVSSTCCGFAVFDHGCVSEYGKYVLHGGDHGERLWHFRAFLRGLFIQMKPDQVVVEQPYPGRRAHTYAILMIFVHAVMDEHFGYAGRAIADANLVPSHTVKRVLGVDRGADHEDNKEIMVRDINRRHELKLRYKARDKSKAVSDDDIADAIALGEAWCWLFRSIAPVGTVPRSDGTGDPALEPGAGPSALAPDDDDLDTLLD